MKKSTFRMRKWLRLRAKNERKRTANKPTEWMFGFREPRQRSLSVVEIWQGEESEAALCLRKPYNAPTRLCFNTNRQELCDFFESIRMSAKKAAIHGRGFISRPSRKGAMPRIGGYADFAKVEYISTAAAVVLAAEYERSATILKQVPPTVNLDSWNKTAFGKLFQLGFFEIVGLSKAAGERIQGGSDTLTMRIVSMKNADDLGIVDVALQKLCQFLAPDSTATEGVIVDFLTALSEAMTNVTNHAYPPDAELTYKSIGRFWVSATADKVHNTLTVVVYDQGITIPVTYPKLTRADVVSRFLRRALHPDPSSAFEFIDDGTYIRAAMRYGGTRTGLVNRGRGLPQMIDLLGKIGRGALTVHSRGGWCERSDNGRMRSGAIPTSIGGTLVEWRVALPRLEEKTYADRRS